MIPPTCSFEKVDKTFSLGGRTTLVGYVVLSYWNYAEPLFKNMCVIHGLNFHLYVCIDTDDGHCSPIFCFVVLDTSAKYDWFLETVYRWSENISLSLRFFFTMDIVPRFPSLNHELHKH